MNDILETMKTVYDRLGDDVTKRLFENRIMYALTGDFWYVNQMFSDIPEKAQLDEIVTACKDLEGEVVYYGAGNDFHIIMSLYPDLKVESLCDRDLTKQRTGWKRIPVISPEQLLEKKEEVHVVIVTTGFHREIKQYLLNGGIQESRITDLGGVLEPLYNRQYFDASIMLSCEEGVFIDGGCYDCSTSEIFVQWCKGKYDKIYGFEPDKSNYAKCVKQSERLKNVEIINKGLWDCEEELTFAADCGQGSKITDSECGSISIFTTSIDNVVKDEKVTFIKLDVEGAELKALQGARNTILNNRPRLAISVYHKPEDIFEIPGYILSLHSDYKLYIRHYQFSECETILYAI